MPCPNAAAFRHADEGQRVRSVNKEDFRAVLGVDLLKEFWGCRYMNEAATALIDYGFKEMGLNRIQASADTDNKRSLTMIQRLGFTLEGTMRQKDFYKGAFHDDVMFSILRKEWEIENAQKPL